MDKKDLRLRLKEMRRALTETEVLEKSHRAQEFILETEVYKNADCIMAYMPLGKETDTSLIIKQAYLDGKTVAFPVTCEETGEITPYIAEKNTCFEKGGFSVKEPVLGWVANVEKIDLVIVPGIGFDSNGNRLGFGKGCYDGFLKKTQAVRMGLCYEFQLEKHIPATEYDEKMDYIVTENGILKCK